jgi:hypothetical protein
MDAPALIQRRHRPDLSPALVGKRPAGGARVLVLIGLLAVELRERSGTR